MDDKQARAMGYFADQPTAAESVAGRLRSPFVMR